MIGVRRVANPGVQRSALSANLLLVIIQMPPASQSADNLEESSVTKALRVRAKPLGAVVSQYGWRRRTLNELPF